MKIAVSAQGPDLDSPVDPRFGRAKAFVVFDTETHQVTGLDNQVNLNAVQGAGIQAARAVAQAGVSALITGNVGPKAFAALQAAEIAVYRPATPGTVREAIAAFQSRQLTQVHQPNVEGHWGQGPS